jgi:hypothetical protein
MNLDRISVYFEDGERQNEKWPTRYLHGIGPGVAIGESGGQYYAFYTGGVNGYTGVLSFSFPRDASSPSNVHADDLVCAIVFGFRYLSQYLWITLYGEARSTIERDPILSAIILPMNERYGSDGILYTEEDAHHVKKLIWSNEDEDGSSIVGQKFPLSKTFDSQGAEEAVRIQVERPDIEFLRHRLVSSRSSRPYYSPVHG